MSILNSTFSNFSSTPFDIHEHLVTLRQARLSIEMYEKINNLIQNQPGLATDVAEIFNTPLEQINTIDDFADELDSLSLKICVALTTFTEFFMSFPLFYFLILFDKYGEDSKKRSLYNCLTSQIAYPVIILIIFNPPFVWRVFMGPLKSIVAVMYVFIQNSSVVWAILCQTEGILTRALFLMNYKYISGINDKLFNTFLFIANIGFSFGSHFCLFFFGYLGLDELLIGVEKTSRVPLSIYYVIVIGVSAIIFGGSLLIIIVHTLYGFQKDKNLVSKIHITLNNENDQKEINQFNTARYNKPIVNTILAVTNTFLLCGGSVYYITSFHGEDSHSEYIQRFWFIWGIKLLIITIFPLLMVVFVLKDFRSFIFKIFTPEVN